MSTDLVPAASSLADRKEYAEAVSLADLLPEAFRRKPANVLIAMEVADALEMRPFIVMQEMSVISGRPSFSAKFIRALVRRAGHKIRETFTDGVARCVIIRADDPGFEHVAEWDEQKARDHDLWGKGHWRKNPRLMLGNRAVSECAREACPEVLGGIAYTPDEIMDFAPEKPTPAQAPVSASGGTAALRDRLTKQQPEPEPEPADQVGPVEIAECDDRDQLRSWWTTHHELRDLIEARVHDLDHVDVETGEIIDAEIIDGGDVA